MGIDQRKSFRILAPDGQLQAVLKLRRRCVNVRMVDSSAGGFAVAASEALPVKRGDVLRLRTGAGWHEVRVVRHESFSDGMLIGLERLGDIDDPRQMQGIASAWLASLFLAGAILAGFVWLMIHDRQSRAEANLPPPAADQMVTTPLAHR